MKTLILAFFSIFPFVFAAYVFLNMIVAAWLLRSARSSLRSLLEFFKEFWIFQYESIPSATIWTVFAMHVFLIANIVWTIKTPTGVFMLPVILIGSAFLISASIMSFVAKMPFFIDLWKNVFTKILVLALPISVHFLAKAFASQRLASMLKINASNVPITHVASTFFFLLLFSGLLFGIASLFFEVIFILSLGMEFFKKSSADDSSIKDSKNLALLMLSTKPVVRSVDRLKMSRVARRGSISLVLLSSFFACFLSLETTIRFHARNLERIVLHAMVFEFDAVPAKYCRLMPQDEESSLSKDPEVKVLPSSSSQEKALVLRRGATLLDPVVFARLSSSLPEEKSLSVGDVVDCLVAEKDADDTAGRGAR